MTPTLAISEECKLYQRTDSTYEIGISEQTLDEIAESFSDAARSLAPVNLLKKLTFDKIEKILNGNYTKISNKFTPNELTVEIAKNSYVLKINNSKNLTTLYISNGGDNSDEVVTSLLFFSLMEIAKCQALNEKVKIAAESAIEAVSRIHLTCLNSYVAIPLCSENSIRDRIRESEMFALTLQNRASDQSSYKRLKGVISKLKSFLGHISKSTDI